MRACSEVDIVTVETVNGSAHGPVEPIDVLVWDTAVGRADEESFRRLSWASVVCMGACRCLCYRFQKLCVVLWGTECFLCGEEGWRRLRMLLREWHMVDLDQRPCSKLVREEKSIGKAKAARKDGVYCPRAEPRNRGDILSYESRAWESHDGTMAFIIRRVACSLDVYQ